MNFGSIFNRFHRGANSAGGDVKSAGSLSGARARRRRRPGRDLQGSLEPLEDRRLLAFQYVGFTHSDMPTFPTSPQSVQYNFEIFNDTSNPNDSATMYMRNLAIQGQLQFDYGTTFSSLTNLGIGTTFNWGTDLPAEGGNPSTNVVGPAALANGWSIDTTWNNPDPASTTTENFQLAKVRVSVRAGTVDPVFVLHVGDSMPLALEVDFSQASGTSTIIIRSEATQGTAGGDSVFWLPHGGGYDLLADRIYIQAATTVQPNQSNNYRATTLVQVENAVQGSINARVSDGDFKIIAGASVSGGTADIRLGNGVPPSARSPYSQYGYGGNGGDIIIEGTLAAGGPVNLQTTSVNPRFITTGPSGLISGSGSITLNNSAADGGAINIRTSGFSQHNIFAGTNSGPAGDIAINVTQLGGNMTINALPASKATISLAAPNGQVITNSNVDTIGGLSLSAQSLNINRPISTLQGDITLTGSAVTIGSNVSAATVGIGNLVVNATGGDIKLTSAAVAKATGDAIILKAAGNIDSQSRLEATDLQLTAGGSITALTRTETVTAKAGKSVTLTDDDAISLTKITTLGDGGITVSAGGLLEAVDVATGGAGDISLTTSAVGLIARDLKTANGTIRLRAQSGDINAVGTVLVGDADTGNPSQDFTLTADAGNVIMSPSATFNVADQLSFNAPLGRVLTPGTVDGVSVTSPGSGYVTAPTVTFSSGSGAAVTPTVGQGKVTFVKVTSGGSGYVTAPSVVFANGGTGGSGAVATAQLTGGVVTGITITNGGLNYASAPTISFVGGGGSGAAATASINGLTALAVSPTGSGYQLPPTVVISSGDGGATGTVAVDSLGAIQGINVSQQGNAFTAAPTVQIVDTSGSGFGASAVANLTGGVTNATVNGGSGGTKYGGGTTATVAGGGGSGAMGVPLLGLTKASIGTVTSLGTSYAVGDLLTVVAGTGAQIRVTKVDGSGAVQEAAVTRGGANYSVGDVLYLNDFGLGASGLRLTVATVTNGGAATTVTVANGGSGFSTSSTINHVGGSGAVLEVDGEDQVAFIEVNSGGSGYTTAPTVTITGINGEGSGATATAFISTTSGRVIFIRVDNPGSGYVNGATVTLTGGGSGFGFRRALATAVVEAVPTGTLSVVRAGSGYTTRPTAITGGSGTGMVLSFNDTNYTVVGYKAIEPGSGYTSTPSITLSAPGTGGVVATLTAAVESVVDSITVTNPGTGYDPATTTISLVPVASGGGATAAPVAVNGVGGITGINLASPGFGYVAPPTVSIVDRSGSGSGAVAVASTALGATGVTISDAGAGYTSVPTLTIAGIGGLGSGAQAIATITNGYLTAITITNPGSGYVNGATVTVSGGGATRQATASITTSHVVTGITMTSSGSGYNPSTTDVVLTPLGSGATGIANLDPTTGSVTSIRITDNGSGYSATNPPTVTLVPFGSGALATAAIAGGLVSGVTVTNPGAGYAVPPVVTFSAPPAGGTTATGVATIGNVAQLSAKRLDWTALEQPLDALLSQFSVAGITLTGSGDLTINRPTSDLTLDKAVTKDGSVAVTAQKLTLNGPVTAGDFSSTRTQTVSLTATGSDLIINFPVTAPATVTLQADAGAIIGSASGIVSGKNLVFSALNGATISTKVETVAGRVSGGGAPVTISEIDDLTVGTSGQSLSANNGPITVSAGGVMTVNRVDAGPNGSVTLTAGSNLLQAVVGDAAEVVAGTASLNSKGGRIDLDTDVQTLSASAPSSTIDIDNISTSPVTLQNVTGGNSVRITASSAMIARSVTSNANNVTLTTVTPSGSIAQNSIFLDAVSATKGIATLVATGDVLPFDPAGTSPNLFASTARINATSKADGIITLRTAVGTLAAIANGNVTISELDAITLGEPTGPTGFQQVKSVNGNVNVTAGGTITATDVVATTSKTGVTLTSTGGGIQLGSVLTNVVNGQVSVTANQSITDGDTKLDVTARNVVLTSQTGSIGASDDPIEVHIATLTASAPGTIAVDNDQALSITSITGGKAMISANGGITQTGVIDVASLAVTGNGAAIVLDTQANKLGAFGATNPASGNGPGTVVVKDTSGSLDMLSSNVASMTVTAAGPVTQSGAITATKFTITGSGKDAIILDTQPNSIGTFTATNGTGAVGIKDAVGALDVAGIQGGPVNIVAGGPLTQSAGITATALTVTGNGSKISLDTQVNKVDSFGAVNPSGTVIFQDATGGTVLTKSNAGLLWIKAAGAITQSGPIVAENLTIQGTGVDPITLDTQDNDIGVLAVANGLKAPVSVKDTIGDMTIAFVDGGPVSLSVAGGLTQTGAIQATNLVVTGTGSGTIQLDGAANSVKTFQASNGTGDIFFEDSSGGLVINGLEGNNMGIVAVGDITQAGPISGAGLDVVSLTGGVKLTDPLNDVDLVSGSSVGDFIWSAFGSFEAGPITASGPTSNIVLTSTSGDITVVDDLTATNLVSLNAPNGTFVLVPPAVISAKVLSYDTLTTPTYNPASVPDTIAVDGNLTITKPGEAVTFGNFTTNGSIRITAASITVNGPLVTTGSKQVIELTAQTGAVTFVDTGSAVSAPSLGGTTTVTAAGAITGSATNPLGGSALSLTSGAAITLPGVIAAGTLTATSTGGAISLANAKNDFTSVKVSNPNRAVTLTDVNALSVTGITGGAVAVTVGDHLTQTGPIVATSLTLASTTKLFGNMDLFNAGNDVGTLTVDNGTRQVLFTDKNGLVIGGLKAGTLTLTTAGTVTQTGPMTVAGAAVITNSTTGNVTLNDNGNDFVTLKLGNVARSATVVDKNDIVLDGVTAANFTLAAVGAVTQTAPVVATSSLAVATINGGVTLTNAGNDAGNLQITSGTNPASFTDKNAVALSTITAGAFKLRTGGAVTQTHAATTTSFDVATTAGGVALTNAGNSLGILSANLAATGAPLTVANGGLLRIAQVATKGQITMTTANGGNVNIGPAATPAPTIQTTSTVNFTGVSGGIVMANGGTIVAPGGVTVPVGKRIQWTLTSSANSGAGSLRDTMQMVNSLKAPSQITYTAPATINLTSALPTVTVPLSVVGRDQLTLDGTSAGATANGLWFASTATGSQVSGVTFQNFGGAGVNIVGAAGTTITGITVSNSGIGVRASGALRSGSTNSLVVGSMFIGNGQGAYLNASGITFGLAGQGNTLTGASRTTAGITITGASANSIVEGNTISQATSGISIVSATGARIGGTGAGQSNSVSYATNGVFASGTCSGTSVIKTTFGTAVTTKYNTSGARGLTIVQ